ncbi:hypothetical protein QYE76_069175 [Lolium multiflorum]|uniref:Uncharacterized protein n=1 Tax=Lolium multiflorum TaxID=4521 RepID=A0AAD8SFS6_LOLMU|nr:hypothetical protein QYE76_069175 [Lolium multiflorum]
MHDEVEFKYYDGGIDWVKVSNDEELATMFAKHKEKEQFHVRLQNDVVVPAVGTSRTDSCRRNGSSSQNSSVRGASVSARRRGGSSNMGTGSRVPREVEPEYIDDEERLYSDVVQNLRRPCRAENRDECDNEAFVIDDEEVEDEDLPAIEWDPANSQMEEGTIFASMSECRNALVTYCIRAERTFEVDKSDRWRLQVMIQLMIQLMSHKMIKIDDPIDEPQNDQIDDPIDEPQNYQIDDPIDDPIDEPQNYQNDDPIDNGNDDPIDDPIEEKIEAPNVGVQPSVVVSSTCSVVGSNKVVAVSSEVVKVPTTKRRRKEAMSTRITRSKVVARSARTKKKPQCFVDD